MTQAEALAYEAGCRPGLCEPAGAGVQLHWPREIIGKLAEVLEVQPMEFLRPVRGSRRPDR
jgi:hypothetical protein